MATLYINYNGDEQTTNFTGPGVGSLANYVNWIMKIKVMDSSPDFFQINIQEDVKGLISFLSLNYKVEESSTYKGRTH